MIDSDGIDGAVGHTMGALVWYLDEYLYIRIIW